MLPITFGTTKHSHIFKRNNILFSMQLEEELRNNRNLKPNIRTHLGSTWASCTLRRNPQKEEICGLAAF